LYSPRKFLSSFLQNNQAKPKSGTAMAGLSTKRKPETFVAGRSSGVLSTHICFGGYPTRTVLRGGISKIKGNDELSFLEEKQNRF